MPASDPVRILLAGAGAFGSEHLARLAVRADVEVVGVADPDPAALGRVRALVGRASSLTDPFPMIDENEADAIVIATPAASHVEICMRSLERRMGVLLEKPAATSAAEAMALAAREGTSDGFVLPGHVLRFSRDHQRIVEVVQSGEIGEVVYVSSRRYRDDSHAIRYLDVDPILTTLVHDIDLACWIAGSEFRSTLAHRSGGPGFRSITAIRAVTATGVVCDLRTAWTFASGVLPADRVEVVGDNGSAELVVGEHLGVWREGRRIDLPLAEADDPLKSEHDHFVACVRDRSRQRALDLHDAIAGLKLADAALESLRTGCEVALRE
jgi:predicted dehydrogenase